MNNVTPPSLPILKKCPYYVGIAACEGYVYGKICHVNPSLAATILALHALAQTLLYHTADYFFRDKNRQSQKSTPLDSQKIFIVTSTLVSMITLVALKEFNLIGQFFYFLLGVGALGYLINRASYIQKEETALFNMSSDRRADAG
ncbi:MAG: hypothetical protein ACH350_00280 [Parachlamydiaceae bacterium]